MKKNAMLKIAAVLLVAVLLTTCAISSTFAKYVSDGGQKSATARVAKWGVVATTEFTGGFGTLYTDDNNCIVSSSDAVVAPGTSGDFTIKTTFDTSKKPEVSFALDYTLTVENLGELPIVFYINDDRTTPYDDIDDLNEAIPDVKYLITDPNFETQYGTAQTFTIHWEWKTVDDDADTEFGKDAANGSAANITLTLKSDIYQLVDAGEADTYKPLA